MRTNRFSGLIATTLLLAVLLASCGQPAPAAPPAEPTAAPAPAAEPTAAPAAPAAGGDKVTLQLKWVAQAQFAGYYAALEKGFYTEEGLDVTIRPGGPDIVPPQVVASGQAQFGIDWLPSTLSNREQGVPLVNIAQIYQYSGMRTISWKESNITSPADLKGKKVAVWFGGNELQLLATLAKYNIDKDKDLELVKQPFDMNLLLNKEVVAASAMTYNEYYQVLAAGHTPEELNIIDFNKEGTAMMEDGIFTTEEFLKDAKNQDIAARFVRASIKGWAYCRDNVSECVDIVLKQDATGVMQKDAQEWQMNEVNKLIWGDPINKDTKVGFMDPAAFTQTAEIAQKYGVLTKAPDAGAYTHDIFNKASGQ
ncbi:MAG: ABC transporter substrate-binding protein [Roseiflexaceae bacterium]